MLDLIIQATFLVILTAYSVSSQTCNNLGDLNVFYDPTCAQGGRRSIIMKKTDRLTDVKRKLTEKYFPS